MAETYQEHSENGNGEMNSREDIKAAIAKAVELRALHAALMLQGNSPAANMRFPSSSSPVSRHAPHLSAQDYPVFTPSYDDEQLQGYPTENRNYAESWGEHTLTGGGNMDGTVFSDYQTPNASSRKGFPSQPTNFHICPSEDQTSIAASCANNNNTNMFSRAYSPGPTTDYSKSRRNSMGDIRSVSSCNKCRPAIISSGPEGPSKTARKSNIIVPLTDSHSSLHSQPRNKGLSLSWLFRKKKNKKEKISSPPRSHADETLSSQMFGDFGIASIETLKKELTEANLSRDKALIEAAEVKSSLGELSQKLEYLETYCEELKKALKQAVQVKAEKLTTFPKSGKLIDGNQMPVSEEVMVEGFLQIASEARLSVKQFSKTLISSIDETDQTLIDNLNSLLQPHKLSLNSRYSKAVLYHLEAIINQSLYQDFENRVFLRNGAPKVLDVDRDRAARFQSFVALRNLSWNEVLRKGTKYYSEEFSKFCDGKMSGIVAGLGCTRPWPEHLLQAFFVAAKCVWLLHLLAFSFERPLGILRVEENVVFEGEYMDDVFGERRKEGGGGMVKVMVVPGFYVMERVIKCRVLCRYNKSVA